MKISSISGLSTIRWISSLKTRQPRPIFHGPLVEQFPGPIQSIQFTSKRYLTHFLLALMNCGFLNSIPTASKPGAPLNPSWATSTCLRTHTLCEQWRTNGDFTTMSTPSPTQTRQYYIHPDLPHSEHSNVRFGQPVSAIPEHTSILQACWGRSAHRHSQGAPTSLFWPPTRQTPPTSPTRSTPWNPTASISIPATSSSPQPVPSRSVVSSNADMSDSSI